MPRADRSPNTVWHSFQGDQHKVIHEQDPAKTAWLHSVTVVYFAWLLLSLLTTIQTILINLYDDQKLFKHVPYKYKGPMALLTSFATCKKPQNSLSTHDEGCYLVAKLQVDQSDSEPENQSCLSRMPLSSNEPGAVPAARLRDIKL